MDSLRVAVRVRPLLPKEVAAGLSSQWQCDDKTICGDGGTKYVFDHVYNENVSNEVVYEELAASIVKKAMEGFHGTLFTYGQSGSGKTFSMDAMRVFAINAMYEYIENCPSREFLIRVSYMELYNERLSDLLEDAPTTLTIREDVERNVFIEGLKEEIIVSQEHVNEVVAKGNAKRRFAETKQNDRSSRAHCIFRMVIESREREDPQNSSVFVSHLNLVDLAGSEKAGENSGIRLKEGTSINKSLLTLSIVIRKLSEEQSNIHINYRDSKLTRILQNALGGNSKTAILCTVSPSSVEETHSTLWFALNARKVQNRPQQNEVLTDRALLKKSQYEIERLKNYIKQLETTVPTAMPEQDELQRQREMKNKLIEQLRSFLCVSSKVKPDKKLEKKRRETVCVPQMSRIADLKDLSTVRIPSFPSKVVTAPMKEVAEETEVLSPVPPSHSSLAISHRLESPCPSHDCQCHELSFSEFEKAFVHDAVLEKYRARLRQLEEQCRQCKTCQQKLTSFVTVRNNNGSSNGASPDNEGESFLESIDDAFVSLSGSFLDYQLEISHDGTSQLKPKLSRKDQSFDGESNVPAWAKVIRSSGSKKSSGRQDASLLMPKPSRFSDIIEEEENAGDTVSGRKVDSNGESEEDMMSEENSSGEPEEVIKSLRLKLRKADIRNEVLEYELKKMKTVLTQRTNEFEIMNSELEDKTKELKTSRRTAEFLENELMSLCQAGEMKYEDRIGKLNDVVDEERYEEAEVELMREEMMAKMNASRAEELEKELQSVMIQRNTEVETFTTKVEELESALQIKTEDLKCCEEKIQRLESELAAISTAKETKASSYEEKMTTDGLRIEELERRLEAATSALTQRNDELDILYEKLQEKVKEIEISNELTQRLENQLKTLTDGGEIENNKEKNEIVEGGCQTAEEEPESSGQNKVKISDSKLEEIKKELQELRSVCSQKNTELEGLTVKIEGLELALQEKTQEFEASKEQIQCLEKRLADVSSESNLKVDNFKLQELERELEVLKSTLEQKYSEIETLNAKSELVDEMTKELTSSKNQTESLEKQLAMISNERENEVQSFDIKLKNESYRIEELEKELEVAKWSLTQRNSEVETLTAELEEKTSDLESSEAMVQHLESELEALSRTDGKGNDVTEETKESNDKRLQEMEVELENWKKRVETDGSRILELERELQVVQSDLLLRNSEIETQNAKLEELELALQEKTKDVETSKERVHDLQNQLVLMSNEAQKGETVHEMEVKTDDIRNEATQEMKVKTDDIRNEATQEMEVKTGDIKNDTTQEIEVKTDDIRNGITQEMEVKTDDPTQEMEVKTDDIRNDTTQEMEVKADDVRNDTTQEMEVKADDIRNEATQEMEVKTDDIRNGASPEVKVKTDDIRNEELEREMETVKSVLTERNCELEKLTSQLTAMELALRDKTRDCETFKDMMEQLESELAMASNERDTSITPNERKISTDGSRIEELERELESVNSSLAQRDCEIVTLNAKLATLDSALKEKINEVETTKLTADNFDKELKAKLYVDEGENTKHERGIECQMDRVQLEECKAESNDSSKGELEKELETLKSTLAQKIAEIEIQKLNVEDFESTLALRNEEIEIQKFNLKDLESTLAQRNEEIEIQKFNLKDLESTLAQRNEEIEIQKFNLKDMESTLAQRNEEIEIQKSNIIDLESTLAHKNEEIETQKSNIIDLESTLAHRSEEIETQKSNLKDLESSLQKSKEEIESITERANSLKQQLEVTSNEGKDESISLEMKVETCNVRIEELERDLEAAKSSLMQRSQEIETLNAMLQGLESSLQEKTRDHEISQENAQRLENELAVMLTERENESEAFGRRLKTEVSRIEELENELETVKSALSQKSIEADSLSEELQKLESSLRENSESCERYKDQIQHLEQELVMVSDERRNEMKCWEMKTEKDSLKLEELEKELTEKELTILQCNGEIETLKSKLATMDTTMTDQNREMEAVRERAQNLEKELKSELSERTKDFGSDSSSSGREREEFLDEIRQLEEVVEEQKLQLAEAEEEVERLQGVIAKGKAILNQKTQELNEAQQTLQIQKEEIQQGQDEIKNLQTEFDKKSAECQQLRAQKQQDVSDRQKLEELGKQLKEEQRYRKGEREYHEDVIRKLRLELRSNQAVDASFQEHRVAEDREKSSRSVSENRMRKIFEFENAGKFMELDRLRKSDVELKAKLASLEKELQQLRDECARSKDLQDFETMRCEAAVSRRKLAMFAVQKMEEKLKAAGIQPEQLGDSTGDNDIEAGEEVREEESFTHLQTAMEEKDNRWKKVVESYKVLKRGFNGFAKDFEKMKSENKELKANVEKLQSEQQSQHTETAVAPAPVTHLKQHPAPAKPSVRHEDRGIQTDLPRTAQPPVGTCGAVESFILVGQERQIDQLKKKLAKQNELLEKLGVKDGQPLKDIQLPEVSYGRVQSIVASSGQNHVSSQGTDKENRLSRHS